MSIRAKRSPYLPLLITGIAIVLSSSAGLARMMGWGSSMTADPGDTLALDQMAPATTGKAGARPRCPECGVIVAAREIESHDDDTGPGTTGGATAGNGTSMTRVRRHEVTVRMADGSSRVNYQASPGNWRPGERVIVIGGTGPSQP
jgi:outer membrane lipoprotein SlyB